MSDTPILTQQDVRQALACLYDPQELGRCGLAVALGDVATGQETNDRGLSLRRLILDAIEELRPRGRLAPSASEYRAYDCITLRYVSSLSVEEIAEELSLSRRQVYRDVRWGEARLAELLQAHQSRGPGRAEAVDDALTREIEALPRRQESVSLPSIVQGAIAALAPLVGRYGVSLSYQGPASGVAVTASPGILREAIVQVLSAVVQGSRGSQASVTLDVDGGQARLVITTGALLPSPPTALLQGALRILEAQGAVCSAPDAAGSLSLRLPLARRYRVLVVEDNPSAVALYERYLAGSEWEPLFLPTARAAGEVAASRRPHAVILDIMMPDTDGWTVLQALKVDPRTREVPVIICSVVDDPELGQALGATAYLAKPIARPALLQALTAALRGHSPA
ncbi:MAG: response regulator [Anaerolineae bacterium]